MRGFIEDVTDTFDFTQADKSEKQEKAKMRGFIEDVTDTFDFTQADKSGKQEKAKKAKIKKKQTKYRPGNPKAALIFGILSWALNIIPYLFPILAIYFSGNSKDPKAVAGRILGIIYCCVTTIAIILIIVMYITSNN